MKYYLLFLLGLVVFTSCHSPKKKYLSADTLEKQIFEINPLSDTTIVTKGGVIIEIPSNSISVPGNGIASLEVSEALSLNDILQSGLTTNSGEQTLSSGGMLCLATSTLGAVITKAIRAKLPVPDVIDGMKTFKGKMDKDSAIQWSEQQQPSLPKPDDKDIAEGKSLFTSNCKACHEVDKDATGPMLSGVTAKRSMNWIIRYTRNFNDLLHECDCEAIEVSNSRPAEMNVFASITDDQVKKIFLYIDKVAPVEPTTAAYCYDTCAAFMAKYRALLQKKEIIKYQYDTTKAVIINYLTNVGLPRPTGGFTPLANRDYYISENVHHSYYYQITIDAWGWYNMDILLKDIYDLSDSKLMVNVPDISSENLTVTLVVPSVKCITNGGLINKSSNQYGFMNTDGSIRLPMGKEAYVLAYGDVKGKFVFVAKQFVVSTSQEFTLTPLPSDTGKLKEYLSLISNNEFNTQVKELETGKQMEAVDSAMANLMKENPKNCSCFCEGEASYLYSFSDTSMSHVPCGHAAMPPQVTVQ